MNIVISTSYCLLTSVDRTTARTFLDNLSSIVASMYIEIGRCVVVDFPDEFGPEVLTEPRKSLKKMSE